ncbi:MAG: flavodoxin family protein [Candidatus Bathyarchaeota archaeon]|nr:flavodoxin family protein [Candidatus Bathyarchaeota archaeon]
MSETSSKSKRHLSMKVLALVGSPRKGGNTDILVNQVLEGAQTKGYTTDKLYLYDYTISLCVDCRQCKKGDRVCCLNDEMELIYSKMEEADVIVFGTPVYWYGPSAKMKMLMDRMRPFVENKKVKGKRAVLVIPAAEGKGACGPTAEMFRLSFLYLDVEFVGTVYAEAYDKAEVSTHPKELRAAYELGCSF